MEKFIAWVKQPSTVKAFVLFAGLIGFAIEPERLTEIITAGTILYGGIAAFWDKN